MNARAPGDWGPDRGITFAFGALELEVSPDPMPYFADEEMNSERRNESPKLTLSSTRGLNLKQEGLPCWPSTLPGVLGASSGDGRWRLGVPWGCG